MTRKLTLSINEKTVEKAKRISRRRGKSISKMVEEYLNSITEKEENKVSLVKESSGILKGKIPASNDWKKTKTNYLRKKHGV
jgi:mRNA-degrading endonuclease RelE of RelBE toxin-antitoxin system